MLDFTTNGGREIKEDKQISEVVSAHHLVFNSLHWLYWL